MAKKNTSKKEIKNKEEIKVPKKEIKNKKNIKTSKKSNSKKIKNDNELTKLIKIVLVVTAIMIVFYGITILVTKNKSSESNANKTSEKAVIQYDEIMIGTLLNQNKDWYYVLIKEEDDNRITEYETLLGLISAKESNPKIYTANLTDSFNKKYLAKEADYNNDLSKFKVTGTTLIEVKDGKITNVYSTYEEIKEELKAFSS